MSSSSKWLLPQKWIESNVSSFTIFSCSVFSSAFAAHVASFVLKSKNFIRLEIWDLLTNFFCFIFASNMLLVNLL